MLNTKSQASLLLWFLTIEFEIDSGRSLSSKLSSFLFSPRPQFFIQDQLLSTTTLKEAQAT